MTDRPDSVDDERSEAVDTEDPGWPWTFILLVVAGALYLIVRFVEIFIRLFN